MSRILCYGYKKAVLFSLLIPALLFMAAAAVMPGAVAGPPLGEGGSGSAFSDRGLRDFEEAVGERHMYYAPEVEEAYHPGSENRLEVLSESMPGEFLPDSLRTTSGQEDEEEFKAAGDVDAAGTGGWMPLTRAYDPTGGANVRYYPGVSWGEMDDSARLHYSYERSVNTDISQAPDPPGTEDEYLSDWYHATYSEGAWSAPFNLTGVSGFEDSEQIFKDVDGDGYLHEVYSRWTWARDPHGNYQHEDENLFYRCMSPAGDWSAPRQLTAYSGSWGMLGAEFKMRAGRLYGTWIMVMDNDMLPASYRAELTFVEGAFDDWGPVTLLNQWDYNDDPG
ncbi:MAG: hypothetical protein ACOC78_02020, partial [Actinomycetota bacterium]